MRSRIIKIMLGILFQIDTKEFLRGIFNIAGQFLWTFKWYFLAIIAISIGPPLFLNFLVRFLGRKKAAIILLIILVLAITAFFIWLYI